MTLKNVGLETLYSIEKGSNSLKVLVVYDIHGIYIFRAYNLTALFIIIFEHEVFHLFYGETKIIPHFKFFQKITSSWYT